MTLLKKLQALWTRPNSRPHVAADVEVGWRHTIRRRVGVATVLFALWAIGIEAKLIHLQIFQRERLEARARDQQQDTIPDPAKRGEILDRNGHILATSANADSIFAVPSQVKEPAEAVAKLCGALRDCTRAEQRTLLERLRSKRPFAFVRRRASAEQVKRVLDLQLKYIGLRQESQRYYPNDQLAAHILGGVGIENSGLGGIEHAYNNQISGLNGRVVITTDGNGGVFRRSQEPSTPGAQLELTIDRHLQHVAERELRAAVQENRALGGSAVVINPRTGEILALANEPTFDPNTPLKSDDPRLRNRAVQDAYEPGSTFKVITAAAAIDEHLVPLDLMVDTSPGYIRIGSRDFSDTARHGVLSFPEVITESSNVGAIKIGQRVGIDRMSRYISAFGFGRKTSEDFIYSEHPGILSSAKTELTMASLSIGYAVSVTPLQVVAAVAAIANGGTLLEPRVVGALYRDGKRIAVQPKVVEQAVSAETAATLTTIMEGVTEHGTGKAARIDGFSVAGKTGTAEKVIDGSYSGSYNASFVGFVPSRDPKLAIIVVIDSPTAKGYYGGQVAAPVFQKIAVAGLQRLGVAPTVNPAPPVLVSRPDNVPIALRQQRPAVRLVASASPNTVPDLRGLSLREATRELVKLGLRPHPFGSGVVVSQSLEPGSPLEAGAVCRLELERSAIEDRP